MSSDSTLNWNDRLVGNLPKISRLCQQTGGPTVSHGKVPPRPNHRIARIDPDLIDGTIVRRSGILIATLFHWRSKWKADPAWRPWATSLPATSKRIFTDEEEAGLGEFIRAVYVRPARVFTNRSFKAYAMQAFLSEYDSDPEGPEFTVWNGSVYDFKQRNGFRARRTHLKW
jgi:hypothetical protein